MNILIYDSIHSNHLFDYVEFIIEQLKIKKKYAAVYIVLNSFFYEKFCESISKQLLLDLPNHSIYLQKIPENVEIKFESTNNFLFRSIYEERFINQFCTKHKIDNVVLLNFDLLQIAIGLRTFLILRRRLLFNGILFSTFIYQPFRSKRRILKYFQNKFVSINNEVKRIYLLNDYRLASELNIYFKTNIFSYLPDPIKIRSIGNFDFRNNHNISEEDFVFISLGRMNSRKNIHNIIKAFNLLPEKYLANTKFLVCGSFDDIIYKNYLSTILTSRLKNNIILVDKFLTTDEFEAYINISNCVCIPYINFFGSSGILGYAARYKKLILASNSGTIAHIVDEFRLGCSVDVLSIVSISEGIKKIIDNHLPLTKVAKFEEYKTTHSIEEFVDSLIKY
jgi:glycosyltransferase involved in cell wall biosynthesis